MEALKVYNKYNSFLNFNIEYYNKGIKNLLMCVGPRTLPVFIVFCLAIIVMQISFYFEAKGSDLVIKYWYLYIIEIKIIYL